MAEVNIRLHLEYKGTEFSGWQFQPGEITIQGEIEKAIKKVTGKKVSVIGAGRTDAGVHALGQVANFRIEHYLPPEKYKDAINFHLPHTILVTQSVRASDEFNARNSALWRHYRYIIDRKRSALYFDLCWEYLIPLRPERLQNAAEYIKGNHDFSAFCKVASQKENNDCDIFDCEWREEDSRLIFDVRANRFLHSMVRSLVGLMLEAGKDKDSLTLHEFKNIMETGDHTKIKHVAPARGLWLVAVGY